MNTSEVRRTPVYLHIGTMKSGTSYLQSVLRRNGQRLADQGIHIETHILEAVLDLRGRTGKRWARDFIGHWGRLVQKIDEHTGSAVVLSNEFLAAAPSEQAQKVARSLEHHQLSVLITARDLRRTIPSHWQTIVRSGETISFPDFADALFLPPDEQPKRAGAFWRAHDLGEIATRWADVVGPDHVYVITLPAPGGSPDALWRRFCSVLDLDPDAYDATPDLKSNVSLTYSEVEMLREIVAQVRPQLDPLQFRSLVWGFLASKVLQRGPKGSAEQQSIDRPQLTRRAHDRVAARAEEIAATVEQSGVHVVGSLDDLRIPEATEVTDEDVPPAEPVPLFATYAMARLIMRTAGLERRVSKAQERRSQRPGAARIAELDAEPEEEVEAYLLEDDLDDAESPPKREERTERPRAAARRAAREARPRRPTRNDRG